jgi:hypothetical protein
MVNAASIFLCVQEKNGPAKAGPPSQVCLDPLANPPASVRIANSTARGRYHDRWDDRHTWRHYSAAVVCAAVVAVTTAAAIWTAVKAGSTAPGNRNCQTGLCLFERRERHGLDVSNAEEADADAAAREISLVTRSSFVVTDVCPNVPRSTIH